MIVFASVSAALVALGLLFALLMALSQRGQLQAPSPPPPDDFPPVSILKPLKGVDADLKENLRSIFRLDYPEFEVLLGTEEPDDPRPEPDCVQLHDAAPGGVINGLLAQPLEQTRRRRVGHPIIPQNELVTMIIEPPGRSVNSFRSPLGRC